MHLHGPDMRTIGIMHFPAFCAPFYVTMIKKYVKENRQRVFYRCFFSRERAPHFTLLKMTLLKGPSGQIRQAQEWYQCYGQLSTCMYTQSTTVSVPSSELGPSLSRKRVCPSEASFRKDVIIMQYEFSQKQCSTTKMKQKNLMKPSFLYRKTDMIFLNP